jgi:hypothetical protein
VHVVKTSSLKELVHGHRQPTPHAEDRAERVRARSQVRDAAQVFEAVSFLL